VSRASVVSAQGILYDLGKVDTIEDESHAEEEEE
jgi:hypothetical protein